VSVRRGVNFEVGLCWGRVALGVGLRGATEGALPVPRVVVNDVNRVAMQDGVTKLVRIIVVGEEANVNEKTDKGLAIFGGFVNNVNALNTVFSLENALKDLLDLSPPDRFVSTRNAKTETGRRHRVSREFSVRGLGEEGETQREIKREKIFQF